MRIDNNGVELNAGKKHQIGRRAIKLDLHIGTEKTGTTSFQSWLQAAQSALAAKGVFCPIWPQKFMASADNRMLSIVAQGFTPTDDGQQKLGLSSKPQYAAICDDFGKAFADKIDSHQTERWILSGEHMQSRLVAAAQVERLERFLKPFFSEIIVHIHLRPQVDVARSFISTLTRMGARVTEDKLHAANPENPYYNYAALVARWENVFGAENIRLIPYKRAPSIQRYFLDQWQLDGTGLPAERKINRAVDWRMTALVNTIKPHRPALPLNLGLQRAISALPAEAPLQLGLERARDITDRMRASNEALVAARPELTLEDLTPNWDDYDHPENFSKINVICDFAAEMAGVIGELQGELILEKARNNVLQAKNLLAAGKKQHANAKLKYAADLMLTIEPDWENRDGFVKLKNFMAKVVLDDLP